MSAKVNISGIRFGFWTVLNIPSVTVNNHTKVWCICDCGNKKLIDDQSLKTGRSTSCGCFHKSMRNAMYKHGASAIGNKESEYNTWAGMKSRCYNVKNEKYYMYGGRGITVCDTWLNSYSQFIFDVGKKPSPKHTLDRFPNKNGNYEPSNCRWATPKEQSNNTRRNMIIEHNGVKRNLSEWAVILNIGRHTISQRLKRGWNIHDSLSTKTINPKDKLKILI